MDSNPLEKTIQAIGQNSIFLHNRLYMLQLEAMTRDRYADCRNKFAVSYARNHFSQSDEDGLTIEICRRIGLGKDHLGTFLEIGVGNGLENNTLVLLSMGWQGCWVGAENLAIDTSKAQRLSFAKYWVTKDNLPSIYEASLAQLSVSGIDVISVDVDGNDYTFAEALLSAGAKPSLFIIEYNGIFPPGAEWVMPYDEKHLDKNVDPDGHYSGASLQSITNLMVSNGYFLCACNPMTGVNSFFVRHEYRELFPDVPEDIESIYVRPFYDGHLPSFYHQVSPFFVESFI